MIMLDFYSFFLMNLVIELHLKLFWLGGELVFRFQIL
jgi:hypothetical protein